ncbi:hypothetical protein KC644_02970 [Candidatus Berkelbacteria bacterium]|nr:hypothetical protein [Candidatus Berkelbacteria bacterium]
MTYKERSKFEEKELQILHSSNDSELNTAYNGLFSLLNDEAGSLRELAPATLVGLVMKGYEIPDNKTRLESNLAISKLDSLLNGSQEEQFWLMIAQQREVILEKIEQDLEALVESKMSKVKTEKAKKLLGQTHKLIRERTDEVVDGLFSLEVSQPELPLGA